MSVVVLKDGFMFLIPQYKGIIGSSWLARIGGSEKENCKWLTSQLLDGQKPSNKMGFCFGSGFENLFKIPCNIQYRAWALHTSHFSQCSTSRIPNTLKYHY